MKVRFYDIVWDTDGLDVSLTTEVTLDVDDDLCVETEGADVLSDTFGWCVHGFDFEVVS